MGDDQKDERVSKDALFDSIVKEAGGFYNLILSVASAFLGGSLLFLEKIAPKPVVWSLPILGLGWLALIVAIGLSAYVRLENLEAGRLALEGKYDEAKKLDRKKECCCIGMLWTLLIGVFLVAAFGLVNIIAKIA